MKKGFAILMALAMLLALTACQKKETVDPGTPQSPNNQETAELAPELERAPDLEISAEEMDGRLPGGVYDLPEKLTPMMMWQREGAAALLAEEEGAAFYGLEGKESTPALLCWDGIQAEFDWQYSTPRSIEPELWLMDLDGDGQEELVVDCYSGSGTGVSLETLYVVEKTDSETLVSRELPWDDLAGAVDEELQTVCMGGRVYAAYGRELVDITADLGGVDPEHVRVSLGAVTHYEPADGSLTASFGVVLEGEGIPYLSTYVATLEGTLRYASDGTFTLTEAHLSSI